MFDFNEQANDSEIPTASKSIVTLPARETNSPFSQLPFTAVPDYFQTQKLTTMKSAFREEGLFSVSPVRSEAPSSKNFWIETNCTEQPDEEDQTQNGQKTPTFF